MAHHQQMRAVTWHSQAHTHTLAHVHATSGFDYTLTIKVTLSLQQTNRELILCYPSLSLIVFCSFFITFTLHPSLLLSISLYFSINSFSCSLYSFSVPVFLSLCLSHSLPSLSLFLSLSPISLSCQGINATVIDCGGQGQHAILGDSGGMDNQDKDLLAYAMCYSPLRINNTG